MKLTFRPQNGDEQSWTIDLDQFRVAEREECERRSGLDWGPFKAALVRDKTSAIRALLFVLIRRTHPTYRWDDVDFCDDEVQVETTIADLEKGRAQIEATANLSTKDKAELLESVDQMIAEKVALDAEAIANGAVEPVDEGKAPPPTSATSTPSTSRRSSTSTRTAKRKP